MRAARLARLAAEAEGLRMRHRARRTVVRLAIGVIGLFFLLDAVVFGHIAIWFWLRQHWEQAPTAGIMTGGDLVLAMFLALLAARSSPSRIEIEALAVRQRAVSNITSTIALSTLVVPLVRTGLSLFRRNTRR
jgi:hypothetical protein